MVSWSRGSCVEVEEELVGGWPVGGSGGATEDGPRSAGVADGSG